jgi:hypothetical protein
MKSRKPRKGMAGKREVKWPVITLMLMASSPSRRDATYGPRKRKSSFCGRTRVRSASVRRVSVKVGFIIFPGSLRPAKLRGVEKGDAKVSMEKATSRGMTREYEEAHEALAMGGRSRDCT